MPNSWRKARLNPDPSANRIMSPLLRPACRAAAAVCVAGGALTLPRKASAGSAPDYLLNAPIDSWLAFYNIAALREAHHHAGDEVCDPRLPWATRTSLRRSLTDGPCDPRDRTDRAKRGTPDRI